MVPAEMLVPGDIVLLESGDQRPRTLARVDAKNLRTDEAALTRESAKGQSAASVGSALPTLHVPSCCNNSAVVAKHRDAARHIRRRR